MPTKYYAYSSDVDTTCDAGSSPHDLNKTAPGSSTSHNSNMAGVGTYTEQRSYQINVSGDSPITGAQSYNLSIDLTVITKADVRFRIRSVDRTGCGRTNSSSYQEFLAASTTAGIKTFSLTLDFTSSDEDLELTVEAREESGSHGTREFTISVDDNDTWVEAPWPAAAGVKLGASKHD